MSSRFVRRAFLAEADSNPSRPARASRVLCRKGPGSDPEHSGPGNLAGLRSNPRPVPSIVTNRRPTSRFSQPRLQQGRQVRHMRKVMRPLGCPGPEAWPKAPHGGPPARRSPGRLPRRGPGGGPGPDARRRPGRTPDAAFRKPTSDEITRASTAQRQLRKSHHDLAEPAVEVGAHADGDAGLVNGPQCRGDVGKAPP